jgi:acetyl-CoA carboxylase carboxyltransferase component
MTFGGRSPLFQESNYEAQLKNIDKLNKVLSLSLYEGSDKNIKRHRERGHLLARERVDLLLDKDSPFLELMPIAGYEQDGMTTGASIVAGIGLVSGVECLISASIPTLYGGAINEMSVLKSSRLHTISVENRLPCINLTQTAGANLSQQSRVFHPGGASFRQMAERSKLGIPTATVVFGSSTAGGAYTPGMSDYVIMVKNKAQVFLGGPPLVKVLIICL